MEIDLYGIKVTDIDVHKVLKFISSRRNKDKNELCLELTLANENIQSWYSHFNHIFSKEIARELSGKKFDETKEVSEKVIKFISRNETILRANESVDYFRDIYLDYKRDYNGKKVKGVTLDKASAIAEKIYLFISTAKGDKRMWLDKAIEMHQWNVSSEEILNTIRKLEHLSEEIQRLTSSLKHDIKCDEESTRELYLKSISEIPE
jgi:hypothetical protein